MWCFGEDVRGGAVFGLGPPVAETCVNCHHLVTHYNEPRPPHDPERWLPGPLSLISPKIYCT